MSETAPATYQLYVAAKFNPISMGSVVTFAKAVFEVSSARHKFLMAWFVFAAFYILALPTIFSASTGYFSPSIQVFALPGGTYIENEEDWVWEPAFAMDGIEPVGKSPMGH